MKLTLRIWRQLSPDQPGGFERHQLEDVSPDLSLLEAIEQQDVDAPYLCRGGACGQCELEVLGAEGELIHHDLYLSADERASGKKIMPCVSRLKGGCLTLNL